MLLSDNPPRWLDLDAPTVAAYVVTVNGCTRWRVTCPHCGEMHYHGPGEGHRLAHCNPLTPGGEGYNIVQARRTWADLLAEIAETPPGDRGPLLEEMDAHEHDAGEEMYGPQE